MIENLIEANFGVWFNVIPFLHILIAALIVIKAIHFYSRFYIWYSEVWLYFPQNIVTSLNGEDKHLHEMKLQNRMTDIIILLLSADMLMCFLNFFLQAISNG